MAYKTKTGFSCSYCGKNYTTDILADSCRDRHELVYVQLSRTDLNRLINFIMLKDDSLITETLMKTLKRCARNNQS
jgi:hypothetical protein